MQRNSPVHLETSLQRDLDVLQSRRFQRKYSLGLKKNKYRVEDVTSGCFCKAVAYDVQCIVSYLQKARLEASSQHHLACCKCRPLNDETRRGCPKEYGQNNHWHKWCVQIKTDTLDGQKWKLPRLPRQYHRWHISGQTDLKMNWYWIASKIKTNHTIVSTTCCRYYFLTNIILRCFCVPDIGNCSTSDLVRGTLPLCHVICCLKLTSKETHMLSGKKLMKNIVVSLCNRQRKFS